VTLGQFLASHQRKKNGEPKLAVFLEPVLVN
jgi:hypothetical protein